MTPESIVVSLDTAQKLKEAGWPQAESSLIWAEYEEEDTSTFEPMTRDVWQVALREDELVQEYILQEEDGWYAAPTSEELLRKLPGYIYVKRSSFGPGETYIAGIFPGHLNVPPLAMEFEKRQEEQRNGADALAPWFCFLSENNL